MRRCESASLRGDCACGTRSLRYRILRESMCEQRPDVPCQSLCAVVLIPYSCNPHSFGASEIRPIFMLMACGCAIIHRARPSRSGTFVSFCMTSRAMYIVPYEVPSALRIQIALMSRHVPYPTYLLAPSMHAATDRERRIHYPSDPTYSTDVYYCIPQ